eukprot:Skav220189  [mRNA]  locus=scaffold1074:174858:184177:- [translate_table: standard]
MTVPLIWCFLKHEPVVEVSERHAPGNELMVNGMVHAPKGEKVPSEGKAGGEASKEKKVPPIPYERPEGNEPYTTVMLRNIPNKYTREMLIKQLSQEFSGEFDFMYLPIDFKNKCNVGYGFINFRTQDSCERFIGLFHGVDVRKCLPGLNSKKIVEAMGAGSWWVGLVGHITMLQISRYGDMKLYAPSHDFQVTPARVQGLTENATRRQDQTGSLWMTSDDQWCVPHCKVMLDGANW